MENSEPKDRKQPDVVVYDPKTGESIPWTEVPEWAKKGLEVDNEGNRIPESKNELPL